jgi:hypothetical protein
MPANDSRERDRAPRDQESRLNPIQAFGGRARRLGDNFRRAALRNRKPKAGDWRATDFDQDTLEAWDRQDSAPFPLPEDPYASSESSAYDRRGRGEPSDRGRRYDPLDDEDIYDDTYDTPPSRRGRGRDTGRFARYDDWKRDEYEDAGWETGTWDTGWADDYRPGAGDDEWDDGDVWAPNRFRDRTFEGKGMASQAMGTIAVLGSVGESLSRVARLRLLLRRRPAAAALLSFLLLGLLLTSTAPLLPLLRLGFDAADAYHQAQSLQALFAGGSSSLLNVSKLAAAQSQLDSLSHDLFEINSLVSPLSAPLGALSPQLRDDRLLVRIGFDLSASADEGLQVARTILTPLQGGALATSGSSPGITAADLAQARAVLADATVRVQDAEAAYTQLDRASLPSQLRPGTKLGSYLHLLPLAPQVVAELSSLMNSAAALLGIGQPAAYLVIALDRSELRPVGGFAGNYGILELDGGRQSSKHTLSLSNVYNLDHDYFQSAIPVRANDCNGQGPQPPEYYWWWPYRNLGCQYGWGLRDAGLSPSFPIDAQTAIQIVQQTKPNQVPDGAALQGVIAFTPVLIEQLMLQTGNITMPSEFNNIVVTPSNLEYLIHKYQLDGLTKTGDRKTFTHDLSQIMLAKIKKLHGAQLKGIFTVVEKALKSKDLQLYFAAPQAELILEQLGLASDIHTGNGDGFYVVDTNDGGNKANAYVSEQQTDVVTLLPNGGALHHLSITVTYNRTGQVFSTTTDDYFDLQRTYLPGDANILGYSGFNPPYYAKVSGNNCIADAGTLVSTIITDCWDDNGIHSFANPVTVSDVPGRAMVMGVLSVNCGPIQALNYAGGDGPQCVAHSTPHTQTIDIEWYTPHAFTMSADGHGTYSEVVEEQPGSGDFLLGVGDYLTVYVDTSLLHSKNPHVNTQNVAQTIGNLKPVHGFDHVHLDSDLTVSVSF